MIEANPRTRLDTPPRSTNSTVDGPSTSPVSPPPPAQVTPLHQWWRFQPAGSYSFPIESPAGNTFIPSSVEDPLPVEESRSDDDDSMSNLLVGDDASLDYEKFITRMKQFGHDITEEITQSAPEQGHHCMASRLVRTCCEDCFQDDARIAQDATEPERLLRYYFNTRDCAFMGCPGCTVTCEADDDSPRQVIEPTTEPTISLSRASILRQKATKAYSKVVGHFTKPSQMTRVMNKFEGVLDTAQTTVDKSEVILGPLLAQIVSLHTAVTTKFSSLSESTFLKTVNARTGVVGTILLFFLSAFLAHKAMSYIISHVVPALSVLVTMGCEALEPIVSSIKETLRHIRMKPTSTIPSDVNASVTNEADVSGPAILLASALSLFGAPKSLGPGERIARSLGLVARIATGVAVAGQGITWVLAQMPNVITQHLDSILGPDIIPDEDFRDAVIVLTALNARQAKEPMACYADRDFCLAANGAYMRVSALSPAVLCLVSTSSPVRALVRATLTETKNYIARCTESLTGNSTRMTPTGVYFFGPPNTGKSSLISNLLCRLLPGELPSNRAWFKNGVDQYATGYAHQRATAWDDYASSLCQKNTPNELIAMISNTPYLLNMAFEKGVPFMSEIIFVTTNLDISAPQPDVMDPGAFMRRFCAFEVLVHPDWTTPTGGLDRVKLDKCLDEDPAVATTLPHMEFYHHPCREDVNGRWVSSRNPKAHTYLQVVTMIKAIHARHKANFIRRMENDRVTEELVGAEGVGERPPVNIINEMDSGPQDRKDGDEGLDHKHPEVESPARFHDPPSRDSPTPISSAEVREVNGIIEDGDYKASDYKEALAMDDINRDKKIWTFISTLSFRIMREAALPSHRRHRMAFKYALCSLGYKVSTATIFSHLRFKPATTRNIIHLIIGLRPTIDESRRDAYIKKKADRDQFEGYLTLYRSQHALLDRNALYAHALALYHKDNKAELSMTDRLRTMLSASKKESAPDDDGAEFIKGECITQMSYAEASRYLWDNPVPEPYVEEAPTWRNELKRYKNMARAKVSKIPLKPVLGAIGIFSAIAGVVGMARNFQNKADEDDDYVVEPNLESYRSSGKKGSAKRKTTHVAKRRFNTGKKAFRVDLSRLNNQALTSGEVFKIEGLVQKVDSSTAVLRRGQSTLRGFVAKDNFVITTRHFFHDLKNGGFIRDGTPFTVEVGGIAGSYSFDVDRLCEIQADEDGRLLDICSYRLNNFSPKRSIVNHFCTEAQSALLEELKEPLLLSGHGTSITLNFAYQDNTRVDWTMYGDKDAALTSESYWTYDAHGPGMCGALLVDCSAPTPIKAMHVGALPSDKGDVGMAIPVTQEMLLFLCSSDHAEINCEALVCPLDVLECPPPVQLQGLFQYVGKLRHPISGLPSKTKLEPSKIFEQIGPLPFEPAYLGDPLDFRRDSTPVTVGLEALSKGGNPIGLFPEEDIREAMNDMIKVFDEDAYVGPRDVLSLFEAFNPGCKYAHLKGLDMSTSPGYPHILTRPTGAKGKMYLFDRDEAGNWFIKCPHLAEAHLALLKTITQGDMYAMIVMLSVKDELRPVDADGNVKNGREINVLPVECNIAYKQYFGSFVNMYHSKHSTTYSGIGMDMYSPDWDKMIRDMFKKSDVGMDGDFSGFQDFLTRQLLKPISDRIERFYAREKGPDYESEKKARAGLLEMLIHHFVVVGPHVIERFFGNSSGNWLTAIINTELSALLTRLSWLGITRSRCPVYATMAAFRRYVGDKYWGDDQFLAVVKALEAHYNPAVVTEFYARYGIKFTPAAKTAVAQALLKPLLDIDFLSNTTALISHIPGVMYGAEVDPDRLEKSLLYVNKDLPPAAACVDNVNDALRRSFSSYKEVFEGNRVQFDGYLKAVGLDVTLITYEECMAMWTTVGVANDYCNDDTLYDSRRPNLTHTVPTQAPILRDKRMAWLTALRNRERPCITVSCTPEMDVNASEDPVDSTEVTDVAVVGAGGMAAQAVVPVSRQRITSYRSLLKRFSKSTLSTGIIGASGMSLSRPFATFATNVSTVSSGWIPYLSCLYRFYKGSVRFKIVGDYDVQVTYSPTERESAGSGIDDIFNASGRNVGMGPTALGRDDVGLLELQMPYYSQFTKLIIPRTEVDILTKAATTSLGSLTWVAQDKGGQDSFGAGYFAGGDDLRYTWLMQVPSVTCDIQSNCFWLHRDGDVVAVPETITFEFNGTSSPNLFRFVQTDFSYRFDPVNAPGTTGDPVTSFTILSQDMSALELNAAGIAIGAAQTREVQIGVDLVVNYGITVNDNVWWDSSVTISGALQGTAAFVGLVNGDPSGTVTPITAPDTGITYQVADGWRFNRENYDSFPYYRDFVGVPSATIAYPFSGLSPSIIPQASELTVGADTFRIFDTVSHYAVRVVPILAESKDGWAKVPPNPRRPWATRTGPIVNQMETGGVSFNDVTKDITSGGRPAESKTPHTDMSEDLFDFKSLASRFQFAGNLAWNTNQPSGATLATFTVPWDLLTSNTNSTPFQTFVYWNGDVHIKFTLQSNTFQQGILIAFYVPATTSDEIGAHISNSKTSQIVGSHCLINAGSTEAVTLEIPYDNIRTRLDLDRRGTQSLGTVVIQVFSPLKTGPAGSQTANLSIWGSAPYSDFQVLDPLRDATLIEGSPFFSLQRFHRIRGSTRNVIHEGNLTSKVTNQTTNITNMAEGTIDFANTTQDEMEAKASNETNVGGMDVPNIGLHPEPYIRHKVGPLGNVMNVTRHQVLDAFPGQTSEVEFKDNSTTVDEMSMDYLMARKSFLRNFDWTVNDPEGTTLTFGELVPNPKYVDAGYGQTFTPTLQGYLSQPFTLWRGSLRYTFKIVSALQAGRLAFCTHYGRTAGSVTLTDALAQYVHVHDLSGGNDTFDVVVPWKSPSPYLKVAPGRPADLSDYSMGEWSLRVVNALNAPSTVSQDVQVIVLVSLEPGFELHFPGDNAIDYLPSTAS